MTNATIRSEHPLSKMNLIQIAKNHGGELINISDPFN